VGPGQEHKTRNGQQAKPDAVKKIGYSSPRLSGSRWRSFARANVQECAENLTFIAALGALRVAWLSHQLADDFDIPVDHGAAGWSREEHK